jgi:ADP-specific Phosphofructokinase/Glucokinase conserved region
VSSEHWASAYERVLQAIPNYVRDARVTLCGLSTFVDAYVRLHEAAPLFDASIGSPEGKLGRELIRRSSAGIGGEVFMDWPEGGAWVEKKLRILRWGVGGTGAQAAQTLAVIGAPALMSLEDRGRRQLSVLHPGISVAVKDGLAKCIDISATERTKAAHYIFEFTAGTRLGSTVLKRSSRTIVRFTGERLDDDPDFVRESIAAAGDAGAGILSGMNEILEDCIKESLYQTVALARAWKERGLKHIHLEVGDYETDDARKRVLNLLGGVISSLGLSYSELVGILPGKGQTIEKAYALANELDLWRLCVHSDTWALSVTRDDPDRELEALLCGSLMASVRAERGTPARPVSLPRNAEFHPLEWERMFQIGNRSVVSCATPYIQRPAGTIGLGDTFLAGTLLVLGGAHRANAIGETEISL